MKDHILWGREESLDHQASYHGEMEASKGAGRNKQRARGKYPGTHSESSNHQGVHRHWSTQINTNRKPIFPTHTDFWGPKENMPTTRCTNIYHVP